MSDWLLLKNELRLTLRPIDTWPGTLRPSWQREKSPYTAPLKDTLKMLRTELNALRATQIVLQIAIRERDLRLDGLPRAGAIAEHPGVILSFKTGKGYFRRAFDRFTKWEHNLRALAMNMEHLRLANLYGVEADDVQYAGWKALPAPQAEAGAAPAYPGCTAEEVRAAEFLAEHTGLETREIVYDAERFRVAYHQAARKLHPDMGGNTEAFQTLQQAADVLKARHKL